MVAVVALSCRAGGDSEDVETTTNDDTSAATGPQTTGSTAGEVGPITEGTETQASAGSDTLTGDATDGGTTGEPCPPNVFMGDYEGPPLGLEGYTEVDGSVRIDGESVADLYGLECLERVAVALSVSSNPALVTLDGLARLDEVGSLVIFENPELLEVLALATLRRVTAGVTRISGNAKLASLQGLDALEETAGDLEIASNSLSDLTGLGSLHTVGGYLTVLENADLVSLAGISSLQEVEVIAIGSNPALASLAGLESVAEIVDGVHLVENESLVSVAALSGAQIVSTTGSIEITGNTALAQCDAEALAATLEPPGWTGSVDVSNNLGTCP